MDKEKAEERILEAIRRSGKYSRLYEGTIRRTIRMMLQRYNREKAAEKSVKKKLHQIYGAYISDEFGSVLEFAGKGTDANLSAELPYNKNRGTGINGNGMVPITESRNNDFSKNGKNKIEDEDKIVDSVGGSGESSTWKSDRVEKKLRSQDRIEKIIYAQDRIEKILRSHVSTAERMSFYPLFIETIFSELAPNGEKLKIYDAACGCNPFMFVVYTEKIEKYRCSDIDVLLNQALNLFFAEQSNQKLNFSLSEKKSAVDESSRAATPSGRDESSRAATPSGKDESSRAATPSGKDESSRAVTPSGKDEPSRVEKSSGKTAPKFLSENADLLDNNINFSDYDVVFLFKTLSCIERQEKGSAQRILSNALAAKSVAVSFPSLSIGGREKGMSENYTAFLDELLMGISTSTGIFVKKKSFQFPNELLFILTKQQF
ncbi:MAG: hypothetical protein LC102_05170 [Ignavibacteriales bacterium]|nr:hypothetical protein [Ignavibacteriales bacterium]